LRVLHIHSGNLYGGVETFLTTLARFRDLAPAMDMAVALTSDGRIAGELRRAGVPVTILGETRMSRPLTVWRARRALASILQSQRPDVAVCHQPWPLVLFGPVAKRRSVPVVLWMHMAANRNWLDNLAWAVRPDTIVCNSRFTAATLPNSGAHVEVVYYPIDGGPAREAAAPNRRTLIIQVSRMEPWKGQSVLLDALGSMRARQDWSCWMVGGAQRPQEQRYMESLVARAARLGIADRVDFLGERQDVRSLLASSDIYCQPNIEAEPFGISFIEAMAAGLPVVTSAIGGPTEIVDETCGVFVPPHDPAALASALTALLESRDHRTCLGANGPARARALCDPAAQMLRITDTLRKAAVN
jgi:glycosyltransferase involved in cell wall biosynthesis